MHPVFVSNDCMCIFIESRRVVLVGVTEDSNKQRDVAKIGVFSPESLKAGSDAPKADGIPIKPLVDMRLEIGHLESKGKRTDTHSLFVRLTSESEILRQQYSATVRGTQTREHDRRLEFEVIRLLSDNR